MRNLGLFTGEPVFHDWEFFDDGERIHPISVGMVSDHGKYYAVNRETDMEAVCAHPFLSKEVLPHLPLAAGTLYADGSGRYLDIHHPDVKPLSQIAAEVGAFVLSHDDPKLWGWYSGYDHVAVAQLFGPMSKLPPGFPMQTNDLKTICDFLGDPRVPEQTGTAHNALADAEHCREIYDFLCAEEDRLLTWKVLSA